ncbi:MAG: FAD-dependent oxidoreductase [Pseudomonadota bacterium]
MKPDVIVVGAGIVGAACAHELARAGLDVLVLDAGLAGATGAGMGHLVLMDDNPAEMALCSESLKLWDAWAPRMDADCAFTRCGTLWIATDDEEMRAAEDKLRRLRQGGVACELLDAAALAEAEPTLRAGLAGGLRVPGDGALYAPNAARWLLAHAPRPIARETATVVEVAGYGVRLADGRWRDCGAVLLAAGIQAAQLCPELPVRPKKGHLAITDRYPGTVHHQLVELGYVKSAHHAAGASVAFNVQPRPTGQLMIGSSRQFDTTDPAVEPDMLGRMLRRSLDYLPGIADLNVIRSWTGFRAATPDGLPVIGAHPRRDGVWLALGHEGLGVTTAPATARLLAAQLTRASLPFDSEPYSAERFMEVTQ